jgi:hypothetical protein
VSAVTWVDFFVEEASMAAALEILVPKLRADFLFQIHEYAGIGDMLGKLPARLRGISKYIQPDQRVVVVRDEDRKDCRVLKRQIEAIARSAGLIPRGKSGTFHVMTRIAVEELEAWFLGDIPALAAAYPGVPATLGSQRGFRDPDAVKGGTWEALERVLQSAGHFPSGLPKTQVARAMAERMEPARNTSRSFQVFRDGVLSL